MSDYPLKRKQGLICHNVRDIPHVLQISIQLAPFYPLKFQILLLKEAANSVPVYIPLLPPEPEESPKQAIILLFVYIRALCKDNMLFYTIL